MLITETGATIGGGIDHISELIMIKYTNAMMNPDKNRLELSKMSFERWMMMEDPKKLILTKFGNKVLGTCLILPN